MLESSKVYKVRNAEEFLKLELLISLINCMRLEEHNFKDVSCKCVFLKSFIFFKSWYLNSNQSGLFSPHFAGLADLEILTWDF